MLLPEPVAVCIQTALKSGRKLSWKLQESARGTLVQLVWKSDLPSPARVNHRPELAASRTKRLRKKTPSQQRRGQRRLQEFLHRKKQLEASSRVQGKERASVTTPVTERSQQEAIRTADHSPAKKQLELSFGAESEAEARTSIIPVAERSRYMATPIKDHSLASHSGTTEDIQLAGLVSCRSVQFVNCDGTPGLHCTSVDSRCSKEPQWKCFATAIEAARDVSHRQRDGVPGLELRRGCTRSSVSGVPVVPSPVACRTRTRTKADIK